jgi:uncharacterized phage-associated protein
MKMQPNKRKIVQTLNYLASYQDNKTISEMKAYKLLWLADRYHLRQYGRLITHDNYYAMEHGVVPSIAKQMIDKLPFSAESQSYLQQSEKYHYKSIRDVNMDVFSDSDIAVLNLILKHFNRMTPKELSDLSHQFPEWKKQEEKITNGKKKAYKIVLEDFFENYEETSNLFIDDTELLSLTKELYSEMYYQ